ncbi:MAG: FAD-dependent oxidoreductase [Planktomarina sp.]|uniref:dihydrolipoyl dehydrogenase family protein n=1 Tax=Planktomarina sp. TaxID=2024851 RepID=UPI003260A17E|nr:FAD-dependent oxidoreductase [Planktomarina sp.]
MEHIETDILVIGGGSGGLSVAAGAVQMGARVVLLEGHKMGGDCLNYGCVPSKALLAAAAVAHGQGGNAAMGVEPGRASIDYGKAKDFVASVIGQIAPHDSVERFEGLGVTVIEAFGRFISPTEVQAGERVITARRIVIATGSSPFVPPIPGLSEVPYYTNETIFDLRARPDHLLVIGGGPIGMEMAQAHRRLGSKVTVIEGQKVFAKDDPELAGILVQKLRDEGIEIVEGALAQSVSGSGGDITVSTSGGSFCGTHLLMAVGRKANIERLNLEAAGVACDRTGIKVDAGLRSSNRRVYAIGDVAGGLQFTHVAGYHAGVVIRSMLFGLPAKAKSTHIPWATYTDPELAQVGLTEAQAREKYGARLQVARFDFGASDRAMATGKTTGLIKVMVVKGRPVGASIVGAGAGELIGIWAMALANNLKMSAIAATVLPYPTMGEINKRVAGAYFSPKLFESPFIRWMVGLVQRFIP